MTRIEVDVAHLRSDQLVLSYVVTGRIGDVRLPPTTSPARCDELWRHTCFEAFIGAADGPEYYEFNFAPSTQWAAYRFVGYRSGMAAAPGIGAPAIDVQSDSDQFALRATLGLDSVSASQRKAVWRFGLSAVIEETSGRLSYWALAHPPGKPDFHHADCFAHEFLPAEAMIMKRAN
ncbi:MAG: DOMON-like domain-containing protein [Xanthobacteraceae bacterium]